MATYQGNIISGALTPGKRRLRTVSGFYSPKSVLNKRQSIYQGTDIIRITNSGSSIRFPRKFSGSIISNVLNGSRKVTDVKVSILPQGFIGSRLVTIKKGDINPKIITSNRPCKIISGYMSGSTETRIETITIESSSLRKFPRTWRRKTNF